MTELVQNTKYVYWLEKRVLSRQRIHWRSQELRLRAAR